MKKPAFAFALVVASALAAASISAAHAQSTERGSSLGDATTMMTPKPKKVKEAGEATARKPATKPVHGDSALPGGEGQTPKSVEARNEAHDKRVAARQARRDGKPSRVTPVSPNASLDADMKRN